MKIVIWTNDQPNQVALAAKIHEKYGLAGVVVEAKSGTGKKSKVSLFERVYEKLFMGSISAAWKNMQAKYKQRYPSFPPVPILHVSNINCEETAGFTRGLEADLIVVSGTRLVKEKLLALDPGLGIINLHTGISPYVKGGPNCTNWCIATNNLHLIGNTIMWIDKGIDTGNLLLTEQTSLTGEENLEELHAKVMEHAHALYIKAIGRLQQGKTSVPNVPQDTIGKGITYYNKDWNLGAKKRLIKNFRNYKQAISGNEYKEAFKKVRTVS